jgi:hypothetical protein
MKKKIRKEFSLKYLKVNTFLETPRPVGEGASTEIKWKKSNPITVLLDALRVPGG